jgi:hypothetical protein
MRRSGAMRAIAIGIVLLTATPALSSAQKPEILTALGLYDFCKDRTGADSRHCRGVLRGFVRALAVEVRGNI